MHGCRESDSPIVSTKPSHNGSGVPKWAEGVERRGLAKGNLVEPIHRMAVYADKILQGAKPGDLPVETVTPMT